MPFIENLLCARHSDPHSWWILLLTNCGVDTVSVLITQWRKLGSNFSRVHSHATMDGTPNWDSLARTPKVLCRGEGTWLQVNGGAERKPRERDPDLSNPRFESPSKLLLHCPERMRGTMSLEQQAWTGGPRTDGFPNIWEREFWPGFYQLMAKFFILLLPEERTNLFSLTHV